MEANLTVDTTLDTVILAFYFMFTGTVAPDSNGLKEVKRVFERKRIFVINHFHTLKCF